MNKTVLNDVVRDSVNKLIREELGIADRVMEKTNEIRNVILSEYEMLDKEEISDGVWRKNGNFECEIFGYRLTIRYSIYNFRDKMAYVFNKKLFTENLSGVSLKNMTFYLPILQISGTFKEFTFGDTIQHEVEHIYQMSMQRKPLLTKKVGGYSANSGLTIYDLANQNIKNDDCGGFIAILSKIIYYTRNEEQDGFVNGLYAQLVNMDSFNNEERIVMNSTPYKLIGMLSEYENYLKDNFDNYNFKAASVFFNRKRKWFINQCEIARRKITSKLTKVIKKARKDFNAKISEEFVSFPHQLIEQEDWIYEN